MYEDGRIALTLLIIKSGKKIEQNFLTRMAMGGGGHTE